jgi:hypothetical protein
LQHPVLIAHRAGGVAHLVQADLAVGSGRHLLREAAAVAFENLKIGFVEVGAGEGVVVAGFALDAQFGVFEVHLAGDRHFAGVPVVGHGVGGDGARVLSNNDPAVHHGVAFAVDAGVVTLDMNEVIAVGDGHRRRLGVVRGSGAHIAGVNRRGRR